MRYIFDISAINEISLPRKTTGHWRAKQTEGGTWALNGFDGEHEIILAVSTMPDGLWDIVILDISANQRTKISCQGFTPRQVAAANRWVNDHLNRLLREQPIEPPPLAA